MNVSWMPVASTASSFFRTEISQTAAAPRRHALPR